MKEMVNERKKKKFAVIYGKFSYFYLKFKKYRKELPVLSMSIELSIFNHLSK